MLEIKFEPHKKTNNIVIESLKMAIHKNIDLIYLKKLKSLPNVKSLSSKEYRNRYRTL